MQNISKRERIILGITAAIALIGMVILVYPEQGQKKAHGAPDVYKKELQGLSTTTLASLNKGGFSAMKNYGIRRMEAPWPRDPFYDRRAYSELMKTKETVKEAAPAVNFVYTGYMEFGGRQIAIINGLEYMEGEALDEPGYILSSISPARVIVTNKTDARVKIAVPLQD